MDWSASHKQIAGHIGEVFDGQPDITRYSSESGETTIDVVRGRNTPMAGIDSYATVGLSDGRQRMDGLKEAIHVELIGACRSGNQTFGSILSNAAFCSVIAGWPLHPGAIFADLVKQYDVSASLPHVLFVEPFLWEDLEPVRLKNKEVLWLMMIPISEAEAAYAEEHGSEALEDLLEEREIDVFDLTRPSTI